jgi:hypothetical protein
MQRGLCARQCDRWQGAPQYSAVRQRPQAEKDGAAQPSAQQCSGMGAAAMGLAIEAQVQAVESARGGAVLAGGECARRATVI